MRPAQVQINRHPLLKTGGSLNEGGCTKHAQRTANNETPQSCICPTCWISNFGESPGVVILPGKFGFKGQFIYSQLSSHLRCLCNLNGISALHGATLLSKRHVFFTVTAKDIRRHRLLPPLCTLLAFNLPSNPSKEFACNTSPHPAERISAPDMGLGAFETPSCKMTGARALHPQIQTILPGGRII